MNFNLTEDRQMLQDMIARFLRDNYDFETRDKISKSSDGFSRELWAEFAELGLIGALMPETVGGYGGDAFDLLTVFQELGRGLVVEPFLPCATLAAGVIVEAGSETQKAMLEEVIAGTRLWAFAHGEPESRYTLSDVRTTAELSGDSWVLNGRKAVVINGDTADTLVISARVDGATDSESGISLFLVDAELAGVSRRGYPTIDGGRAAEISLENVTLDASMIIGESGAALEVIEKVVALGIVALCAEAVGAMEAARDLTVEFLQTRTQFGQPIGKFQALQHRMANLLTEIEQAYSITIHAAGSLNEGREVRELAVSAAKNLVGRIGRLVSEEVVQMHGGIGMTWEYSGAHYAKRLIMIDHLLGDTDHHLERFIEFSHKAA